MQKITLKPIAKELLHRVDDPSTHYDVFSYSGTTTQEKQLGNLYVVGLAKYDDEDLGYVVSLIGSLARREYYGEQTQKQREPRIAFEQTLKKLNEVLDDFFANKQLELNIGVLAVAGQSVCISKLGKFKVALARSGEYIDVLNNLILFQKSTEGERKFSNVISGDIQAGDKLFAYFPSRSVTSREKGLRALLVSDEQEQFAEHVAELASANPGFSCCGVHLAIEQIKEIPLESPQVAVLASAQPPMESPKPIAAELSVGKKSSYISSTILSVKRSSRRKIFAIMAVVILVPLAVVVIVRGRGAGASTRALIGEATQNIKKAQAISPKDARALLWTTASSLIGEEPKVLEIKKTVISSLDALDKTKDAQIAPASAEETAAISKQLGKGAIYDGNTYALIDGTITKNGKIWTKDAPVDGIALAIDGSIFVMTKDGKLKTFFRGEKKSEVALEFAPTDISIVSDTDRPLYALDKAHRRIYIVGKTTGLIEATYKLDVILEPKEVALDSSGNLFVSDGSGVWKISETTQ